MISVIIPTYNEEGVILDCLNSLSKQSLKDFEVIVVDDGSTDSTYKVVSEFKIKNLQLRSNFAIKIMRGAHLGAGGARNAGAKMANGDILVFVDADMTFDRNFLKNLVKPIGKNPPSSNSGEVKGTFSKDEYVSNWDNIWARCYNLNEGWENKKRHPKNYPDTQKVFRAILKSEFDKVGGFTAGGYNDDWSLSEKLEYEATASFNAVFYHKNPDNLEEIYNHAKWVGKREYKLGMLGYLVGLVRSSFPVSIALGVLRSTFYMLPAYLIFKLTYDFGVFIGILNYIFTKKGSK